MTEIETNTNLRMGAYQRALNYTYDGSLGGGQGGFHYVFNEGALDCSVSAQHGERICICSKEEMSAVQRVRPSFVYADVGCWVDNADGNNTKRRDFLLVCGVNVYLCEFVSGGSVPTSNVASVDALFRAIAAQGHGIRVIQYGAARPPLAPQTATDPNLYLFVGDLHLPPVSWFHTGMELAVITQTRQPPHWLANLPAMKRQPDYKMLNYYTAAQLHREGHPNGPRENAADIFKAAGLDLICFLDCLSNLPSNIKSVLHFIQTGDMFEMWLSREYQYQTGLVDPQWIDAQSVNRVSDWGLEVIIQNRPLFEAFRKLDAAGLVETKYTWGNHDAYLKDHRVTQQLGQPRRDPSYKGLSGDVWSEHGHRIDRSNFDNVSSSAGPTGANAAFYVPVLRKAEPMVRAITSIGHPSKERDCYLLGATLDYLHERFDLGNKPFAIFVMGHSHSRQLFRFDIRTTYSLHGVP